MSFAQGVNRFVFHRYAHQPYLGRFPGVTMGPWGLHYERTNTWWEMSGPWHDYVARCSYVLRQGNFVADILYARPEMPNQTYFSPNPAPPPGYNYDEASARAIMDRATVEHGRIVLPDGMSYRLLVLSPASTMTPQFLGKIRDLVAAGACVLGPPPHSSPSLQDYPHCDDEVANTVKQVWGSCDGKAATEHAFGTGTVFNGLPLADLLQKLHTPPDFYSDTKLNWIHRCVGDKDIYFVANPTPEEVTAHCTFRVTGLHAEAWNPEDGTLSELQPTNQGPTDTAIDLRLDPTGSLFVVFRPTDADATYLSKPPVKTKVSGSISGPWHLQFSPGWGAPEKVTTENLFSWSDSPVEGIKYYSGTATYTGTFSIKSEWLNPAQREFLDLGEVEVIARVRINGKDKGILWKPPYKVEITGDLTAGDNTLDISVANHCGICAVPEFANVLTRARIKFHQIIGHLDSPACWKEIGDWISAAQVVKGIEHNRLGVMGHYYSGMLDIYTDLTLQSVVFGTHIEILEVDELTALRREVTEEEASLQVKAFHMEFDIRQDCSQQELMRAARTAVALGRLIKQKGLGSLAYYYKGTGVPENQDTITSIILGNSLLTARGCPVAGELEIKNVQAMKILDLLGVGGSFTEYYAVDWKDDVVLMGHDGPGHIGIAQEKPRVRPLEVYHGKVGEGLSIEMSVRHGPVTLLSVVETANGCIKLLCAEGECIPGPLLEIGNTNSRFRFAMGASQFIQRWNAEGPAHHCAVGTGHLANIISKIASLLEVEIVTLTI